MNIPPISSEKKGRLAWPDESVKGSMPILGGPKQPSGDWELFLGMWERANLVRAFFWTQRIDDEKLLLTHFLTRLRRFFSVDVCFGALSVSEETLVEVGVPEAGLRQLPAEFSRRCMESLANSKAPVTWNEAGIGLGFRSTVVVPLRAPTGPTFGFLLLGQVRARNYSAIELFVLQALAGELSWVARDLESRKISQQKLACAAHGMKNMLQVVIGNAELMRQIVKDGADSECGKYLEGIEAAVHQITDRMRILPDFSIAAESPTRPHGNTVADIAAMVTQSASSCRASQERGVDVEVVYAPEAAGHETLIPDNIKGILGALVDNAALAARNETVRVTMRRDSADLEVVLRGMGSSRVADTLKSVFEAASRSEGARDENGEAIARVRQYLDNAGGDMYLKNRPGDAAEFVVRVPLDRAPAGCHH